MSNKEIKYNQHDEEDEEKGGGGSAGGAAGEIKFRYHDILSEEPRDDVLTPEEITRLLAVHKDIHKERVDKQKVIRKERKAVKEGPAHLVTRKAYTGGTGGGTYSKYKTHPIAIKFSGIRDQQITAPETNKDLQQELVNKLEDKLENKLRLQNAPRFTPKPRPF